jgi:hypothetical protein
VGRLCALLNSDQPPSQEKTSLENAIKALFEINENIGISGNFLVEMIRQKYGSQQSPESPVGAFQKELIQYMRTNYPPVLSKSLFGASGSTWIKGLADKLRGSQITHDASSSYYSSKSIEDIIKQALSEGRLTDEDIKVLLIFWEPSSQELASLPRLGEYFKRQTAIEEKQYDALISGPFDSIGIDALLEARFARTP